MSEREYPELTKEIDRIIDEVGKSIIDKTGSFGPTYDPFFQAFDSTCSAHIECHLISSIVSDCAAIKNAFIMGMMVADHRSKNKEDVQELFRLYNKKE